MATASLGIVVLLGPLLAVVAGLFQFYAPQPYMTQQYCKGNFHQWDPKITTLPGLYILGAAYAHLLQLVSPLTGSLQAPCSSTACLRSLNIIAGLICISTFQSTYRRLHPGVSANHAAFMALLMGLFPLHFFFHFLFYTDVGSLMFVLAAYLASLKQSSITSAALGAWAVLFRQTNAVWVCFIIAVSVLDKCSPVSNIVATDAAQQLQQVSQQLQHQPQQPEGQDVQQQNSQAPQQEQRQQKQWQQRLQQQWQRQHQLQQQSSRGLLQQILYAVQAAWMIRWPLLKDMWALLMVPVAFAAFVVWNGGIVLGDKAAHAPVRHLVQPLYFLLFSALALAPFHFFPSRLNAAQKLAMRSVRQQPFKAVMCRLLSGSVLAFVINKYTLVHPYLLADNRHYTFYLWKNFFARYSAARYALIPLYMYCTWSVNRSLAKTQTALWRLLFALCTAATLVPAWLVEFRYFTTPFAMLLLHMQPLSAAQLRMTLAGFALVNVVSLYMYLCRPFVWPDGSIARFIW